MAKGVDFTAMKSNRRPREKGLTETRGLLPAFIRHLCGRHCEQKRWDEEAAKSLGGGLLGGFGGRKETLQQDHTPKLSVEGRSRGTGFLSKEIGPVQHGTPSTSRFGVTNAQGVGRH